MAYIPSRCKYLSPTLSVDVWVQWLLTQLWLIAAGHDDAVVNIESDALLLLEEQNFVVSANSGGLGGLRDATVPTGRSSCLLDD
jgi:hypothetical protein